MQLRGMDHSADGSEGMRSTPDNVEYAGRGRPSFARAWVQLLRLLLVMISAACTAVSAVAGDEQDCFQGREPELRIRGCSQLIQRAPADATAYHNRAVAYGLAGDLDKAIADYTKVIELAPSNARSPRNQPTPAGGPGSTPPPTVPPRPPPRKPSPDRGGLLALTACPRCAPVHGAPAD
jgi:tetratricopeptide (TPR) repeat protein